MTGERSNEDDGRCEGCGAFFACTCPSTGAEWLAALDAVRVERDALAAERDHWESVAEDNAVVAEDALARAAALQTAIEAKVAELSEFAEYWLYDGDIDHALPGYNELHVLVAALAAAAVGAVPETQSGSSMCCELPRSHDIHHPERGEMIGQHEFAGPVPETPEKPRKEQP